MWRSHHAAADEARCVGVLFSNEHMFITHKCILPYAYSIPTCEKFLLRRTFRNVTTAHVKKCLDKYYIDMNSYTLYCRLNLLCIILFITQMSTAKQHSYPCACQESIPWSGGIDPFIFKLGIRWSLVVTFTHRPLYSWRNLPRYPSNKRLSGPQHRFRAFWRREKLFFHCR
jgi:hypothetical protein